MNKKIILFILLILSIQANAQTQNRVVNPESSKVIILTYFKNLLN